MQSTRFASIGARRIARSTQKVWLCPKFLVPPGLAEVSLTEDLEQAMGTEKSFAQPHGSGSPRISRTPDIQRPPRPGNPRNNENFSPSPVRHSALSAFSPQTERGVRPSGAVGVSISDASPSSSAGPPSPVEPGTKVLRHLSINRAKGLDALAVILLGTAPFATITMIDDQYTYFMGASRAKQLLAVVEGI
jgi:hypothetical protein